jgi:hypothetical protein
MTSEGCNGLTRGISDVTHIAGGGAEEPFLVRRSAGYAFVPHAHVFVRLKHSSVATHLSSLVKLTRVSVL